MSFVKRITQAVTALEAATDKVFNSMLEVTEARTDMLGKHADKVSDVIEQVADALDAGYDAFRESLNSNAESEDVDAEDEGDEPVKVSRAGKIEFLTKISMFTPVTWEALNNELLDKYYNDFTPVGKNITHSQAMLLNHEWSNRYRVVSFLDL